MYRVREAAREVEYGKSAPNATTPPVSVSHTSPRTVRSTPRVPDDRRRLTSE